MPVGQPYMTDMSLAYPLGVLPILVTRSERLWNSTTLGKRADRARQSRIASGQVRRKLWRDTSQRKILSARSDLKSDIIGGCN